MVLGIKGSSRGDRVSSLPQKGKREFGTESGMALTRQITRIECGSNKERKFLPKRFYILFVARGEDGQLRKIPIPTRYLYVLVVGAVVGILGLTGLAIALDNLWLLMVLVPFALLIRYGVVAREEAYLERKFGDVYRGYRSRVRRWLYRPLGGSAPGGNSAATYCLTPITTIQAASGCRPRNQSAPS